MRGGNGLTLPALLPPRALGQGGRAAPPNIATYVRPTSFHPAILRQALVILRCFQAILSSIISSFCPILSTSNFKISFYSLKNFLLKLILILSLFFFCYQRSFVVVGFFSIHWAVKVSNFQLNLILFQFSEMQNLFTYSILNFPRKGRKISK